MATTQRTGSKAAKGLHEKNALLCCWHILYYNAHRQFAKVSCEKIQGLGREVLPGSCRCMYSIVAALSDSRLWECWSNISVVESSRIDANWRRRSLSFFFSEPPEFLGLANEKPSARCGRILDLDGDWLSLQFTVHCVVCRIRAAAISE